MKRIKFSLNFFSGSWPFFLLFALTFTHYFIWVQLIEPLPEKDGLAQYYYPLLNYLKAAELNGNDYQLLTERFFGNHYPHGAALIAWIISSLGLGAIILSEPYLLHIIILLPLIIMPYFLNSKRKYFFLAGICLYFFPPSQVCLKLFSLQAINVIYFLLAILFLRSWLSHKKPHFLLFFVFSCWFSGIAKHLGVLFFLSLISAYLSWEIIAHRYHFPVYGAFALVITGLIPFYYLPSQPEYIISSIEHGPGLELHSFLQAAVFLFIFPPIVAFIAGFFKKNKTLPRIFHYGLLLFLLSTFSLIIVAGDFFTPRQIIFSGMIIFILMLFFYDLKQIRGFIYIFIILNFTSMLALYRTGAGHVPYTLFLALMLAMVQTISENNSRRFQMGLAFIVIILSNFFPNLKTLDHYFGYFGRRIYLGGFKSPHQNPLGWHKYCYGELKKQVISELSKITFKKEPRFLVHNFGPLTEAQFVFFDNVLYPFPKMGVLRPFAKEFYELYLQKNTELFTELLENNDIPIVLYATITLPEEDREIPAVLSLTELLKQEEISKKINEDLFADIFNRELILWLEKNGFLEKEYYCQELPKQNPCARLCISRKTLSNI